MKRLLTLLFAASLVSGTLGTASFAAEGDATEESLLFMEVPVVVTASKRAESINKAPSIVYVITAEEIKRSGARSLAEVLKRVPGFKLGIRETSLLGSRGFTSDQNDKYVFLIDGAPMTNIMQDGSYGYLDMPNLSMVEKIEVVKGPGSTLWGSDASLGIINIFTKTGEQVGGLKTTVDYATNDNWATGNFLYGRKTDTTDMLFSFTYTDSKGWNNTAELWNTVWMWGGPADNSNINPFYGAGANSKGNRLREIQPSWEAYSKIKSGDLTVKTRASYSRFGYLWNTNYDASLSDVVYKHFYTELEKESKLSDISTLTSKVNVHNMTYERGIVTSVFEPSATVSLETKGEMGISYESILNTKLGEKHDIVAGVKAISVQYAPSTRQEYFVGSGSTTLDGAYYGGYQYTVVTDPGLDTTVGVYAEDSFKALEKLTLVAGLSCEYNDKREQGAQTMPRGAIIYDWSDLFSTKYTYNTGYERPPIDKKLHKHYGNVTKSEKISENDLQLSYNGSNTRATVTGFDYKIENYFTWIDESATNGPQGHGNKGEAKSQGFECEVRHNFSGKLSTYGNFSYAETKIDNNTPSGDPKQIYNIGSDYYFTKNTSLNVNVNGWADMYSGSQIFRGEKDQIVDATVVFDNLLNKPLTVTIYALNLLNNKTVPITMTGWPGYTYEMAASIGTKVSYKF